MKNRKLLISMSALMFFLFVTNSCKMIDRANKNFEYFEYAKAIPKYKSVLEKDSTNTEAWCKLGDCYRMNNQTIEAEACYRNAVRDTNVKNIYKLYYAQMMVNNVNYSSVHEWVEDYMKSAPDDSRAAVLDSSLNHIDDFIADKDRYTVQKININTDEAEYGPALYMEGIVFSSSRADGSANNKSDLWTGQRYYSVYYSKGKGLNFEKPSIFLKGIQTKYNNSSACFTKNGNEMAVTRNNVENEKDMVSQDSSVRLKLYTSLLKNGIWTPAVPFQYNSDSYSCAHPAFSPDGSKLYFSSDMPGSRGGMDIWVCTRKTKGWSKPINLGDSVNTAGNEVFPTVSNIGTIYFSSNGLEGLGGLDIYYTNEKDGKYSKAINTGAPLNSSDDDFGLVWDTENKMGYFSSNRVHQGHNDDLYCITKNKSLIGLVYDKNSDSPLKNSQVKLIQEDADIVNVKTDGDGNFNRGIQKNKNYKLIAVHPDYKTDTINFRASDVTTSGDSMIVKIMMERKSVEITIEGTVNSEATLHPVDSARVMLINLTTHDTLETVAGPDGHYSFSKLDTSSRYRIIADGRLSLPTTIDTLFAGIKESKTLQMDIDIYSLAENNIIRNIYYDLNKFNIRKDAGRELDKLAGVMKRYPGIEIDLGAHTDSRASYLYNMDLSQKRAKSAVEYLVKKGINNQRMTARGYGESKLINKCVDEGDIKVFCTEQDHQLNRRTEITVRTRSTTAIAE